MSKSRMEIFSDALFAIIMTVMVLELKVPHGVGLAALRAVLPVFLTYVLSFVYLGIYWNNHHHLLSVTNQVSGGILWANLHLLFWLSLIPFVSGWMGENRFAVLPTALYGAILLLAGCAYLLLQREILVLEGPGSVLAAAVGKDWKGKVSLLLYALGIALAFLSPWMAGAVYVTAALMWLVPDRRIERKVAQVHP
ncbi:MAG TPA: TMEM175 family protein [Gemmatimonadales bacterium]|nr:TMEM175 family protein [Gemmatimonadales bacterium]